MATVEAARPRLREQLRDYQRLAGQWLAGPILWALIVLLFVYSLFVKPEFFVVGVVVGSILALGALGLTLIYGILKFGNFAHGDTMMLAAYLAFFALTGRIVAERPQDETEPIPWSLGDLPGATDRIHDVPIIGDFSFGYGLLLAMLAAMVVTAALSVGLDRLIYRPLRRRRSGIVIFAIASLGVAVALRSVMLLFWGPDPRFYQAGIRPTLQISLPKADGVAGLFTGDVSIVDIKVVTDQIFMFAAAASIAAAVYLLLYRTKLGKAMRAMADNPDLARVSGINTDRVIMWTWVIGGALAAIAGVLLALQVQLNPNLGFGLLLPLFAAAILGGIGSPHGALLGALVVGVSQEVSVGLDLDFIRESFPDPGYKLSVAFVILVLVLLLRPRGLFGERGQ